MGQGTSRLPLSSNQVRVAVVLAVGLWFGARYAHGVLAVTDTQHKLTEAQQSVDAAKARRDALRQRLEYVKTDAYVESVARESLLLVKPGDVSVKVIPSHAPPVADSPAANPAPESTIVPIEQWRQLFLVSAH